MDRIHVENRRNKHKSKCLTDSRAQLRVRCDHFTAKTEIVRTSLEFHKNPSIQIFWRNICIERREIYIRTLTYYNSPMKNYENEKKLTKKKQQQQQNNIHVSRTSELRSFVFLMNKQLT